MAAADSSMTVMDDVDAAVSVATSAHCEGADRAVSEGTAKNNVDPLDGATETAKDEDVSVGKSTQPVSLTAADGVDNTRESADSICPEDSADGADQSDSRSMEVDDSVNQSAKDDGNGCESDGDGTNERTCLEAMTPDGQDYYLRLGVTPQRRSALRLSRIIARQQLLRRLAQVHS